MRVATPFLSNTDRNENCATEAQREFSSVSGILLGRKDVPTLETPFTLLILATMNELLESVNCKVCSGLVNIAKGNL